MIDNSLKTIKDIKAYFNPELAPQPKEKREHIKEILQPIIDEYSVG